MKLFLFKRVEQVTEYYHPEGGLAIVANDEAHARALLTGDENIQPTDEEWAKATVYELVGEYPTEVYIFPDAGCCG